MFFFIKASKRKEKDKAEEIKEETKQLAKKFGFSEEQVAGEHLEVG